MNGPPLTRQSIHDELDRVRRNFHALSEQASAEDLHRPTDGTRWTNRQLLFHMLLGYLLVRTLLGLVRTFGRLPERLSVVFARTLNSATTPFHAVNYLGACVGALVFRGRRLTAQADRTIASLHRQLDRETEATLGRTMHFPVGWDPFFTDTMSLLEVYHYATRHYDFHSRQLTLPNRAEPGEPTGLGGPEPGPDGA